MSNPSEARSAGLIILLGISGIAYVFLLEILQVIVSSLYFFTTFVVPEAAVLYMPLGEYIFTVTLPLLP